MLYVEQLEHRVFSHILVVLSIWAPFGNGGHYESCFSRGFEDSWSSTTIARTIAMIVVHTARTARTPKYALGIACHMIGAVTSMDRNPINIT
jgi:hypothetical protein